MLGSCQNPHIDSLICATWAIRVGKAKVKPNWLYLAKQQIKSIYHISEGIAEMSGIIRDLKDAGVVIPTTSPVHSPIWFVQNTNGN